MRQGGGLATGKAAALIKGLVVTAERTRRVAAQTRQRLAGTTPDGATRIVSLHDPDARPIVKGRLGKPVEFGYKAQLVDNDDGVNRRPQRRDRQPGRRPPARTGDQADQAADRAGTAGGHRRSWLRRGRRRRCPPRSRSPPHRSAHQRQADFCPPANREPTGLQEHGPMANRLRGSDQLRQTRLRACPNSPRRDRRRPNLVRSRSVRPQPRQDQRPARYLSDRPLRKRRPPPDLSRNPKSGRHRPGPSQPPMDYFRSK